MKAISYLNIKLYGGLALDKRSKEFRQLLNKEFNTSDMQRIACDLDLPVEVVTLRVKDLNIFHNFETGILGNQLN